MPVPYNKYDVINDQVDLPAWSTIWPGSGGCNSRSVYYGTPIAFTGPPAASYDTYEPETVRVSKDVRHLNGRRRGYPPYRFTPYFISRTIVKRHLLRKIQGSNGLNVFYQYGIVPKIGSTCTPTPTSAPSTGPLYSSWYEQTHDPGVSTTYTMNGFDSSEVSAAIAEVEDQVSKDSMTSFDLFTEIAEARELPGLVTSVSSDISHILRALRGRYGRDVLRTAATMTPRQLLKSTYRILRKLGDEWMAYRYGIMPLVYSYRDAIKTANRHETVTDRAYRSVAPKDLNPTLPGPTSTYLRVEWSGEIVIRGTTFQAFSADEAARLAGLGTNPLVTAWELLPYSFVADWFVNVGDYIARKTGRHWARDCWACLSRRDTTTKTTYVHYPNRDDTVTITNKTPTNWFGSLPPASPAVVLSNPEGLYPLTEEITNSYSRWLFDVRDARLRMNPSLNWKRMFDSAVMANNILRNLMNSLRKGH